MCCLPNVFWFIWIIYAAKRRLEGNTQEMSRANSFADDTELVSEESPLPAVSNVAQ